MVGEVMWGWWGGWKNTRLLRKDLETLMEHLVYWGSVWKVWKPYVHLYQYSVKEDADLEKLARQPLKVAAQAVKRIAL